MEARVIRAEVMRRLGTAGAVLAIVMASMIGLHDWADGAATHDVVLSDVPGQGPAAS
jgi:hypothetical protein